MMFVVGVAKSGLVENAHNFFIDNGFNKWGVYV